MCLVHGRCLVPIRDLASPRLGTKGELGLCAQQLHSRFSSWALPVRPRRPWRNTIRRRAREATSRHIVRRRRWSPKMTMPGYEPAPGQRRAPPGVYEAPDSEIRAADAAGRSRINRLRRSTRYGRAAPMQPEMDSYVPAPPPGYISPPPQQGYVVPQQGYGQPPARLRGSAAAGLCRSASAGLRPAAAGIRSAAARLCRTVRRAGADRSEPRLRTSGRRTLRWSERAASGGGTAADSSLRPAPLMNFRTRYVRRWRCRPARLCRAVKRPGLCGLNRAR